MVTFEETELNYPGEHSFLCPNTLLFAFNMDKGSESEETKQEEAKQYSRNL